jgi:Zn finger protein HypA/HybF involved in hydrogenase expression
MDANNGFELEGQATLFGFDPVPVHARIMPRTRAWRVGGAARTMAIFVVIAPIVMIMPPHAVWPIGALLTGGVLARKRFIERFTITRMSAKCPKCGGVLEVKPQRLRVPHPVPCDNCHHEANVRFPDGVLEEIAAH